MVASAVVDRTKVNIEAKQRAEDDIRRDVELAKLGAENAMVERVRSIHKLSQLSLMLCSHTVLYSHAVLCSHLPGALMLCCTPTLCFALTCLGSHAVLYSHAVLCSHLPGLSCCTVLSRCAMLSFADCSQ